ncbi:hypothetical protein [Streptomyces turgidiscabies]|uniref:Lipoprotein n=1 Tax=Streptomyces turgidiscabies TaxID=85558 RepID=A0ABU0RQH6_9ACTN|nr:hypothetical protein [Streptomyces turgidiscabies]MDQ0934238.1 hypothetical protein [Streptomyces turgidiscabies]
MPSRKRLMVAGISMILMATLGACGGGGGGGNPTAVGSGSGDRSAPDPTPTTDTVTGLRDAVRHITRKTARATRPHLVQKCTTTKSPTGSKGSKGSKSSRKCSSVHKGTETYTRVVRQERWCVSLNDVNGDTAKDAVWYEVTHATYTQITAANRLAKVKFTPEATGCEQ